MLAAIVGFLTAAASIATAIWEIVKVAGIYAALATFIYVLFTKDGADKVGQLIANITSGALHYATILIGDLEGKLNPIAADMTAAIERNGGALQSTLAAPFKGLARDAFEAVTSSIEAKRNVKPEDWRDIASDAMADAFGFGLASHGVAMAFESIFPPKLNTLNGLAPLLGELAGFAEVTGQALGPLLSEGIGVAARYDAASKFRAHLPNLELAAQLHARGLITQAQYDQLAAYNGIAPDYQAAISQAAYRAISPFQMIRAAETGVLDDAAIEDELSFSGLRPASIERLKAVSKELALQPYKQAALNSVITAYERGTITDADFANTLAQFNLPDGAEEFIQLNAAYRKLEQLAEIYRKSVDEAYTYGEITDAEYLPKLEAIGINVADAEAHYAVASMKVRGKQLQAEARAEVRQEAALRRNAVNAAVAQFRSGFLNVEALTAALIASGENPAIAAGQTAVALARQQGNQVRVYNLLLSREDAALLKARVAAIQEQTTKGLISPAGARSQLLGLQISEPFASALIAKWTATAATKVSAA